MYEECPPTTEMNDQVYLTEQFLKRHTEGWIHLDTECFLFQTIGFCEPERDFNFIIMADLQAGRFGVEARNKLTNSNPVFWHGNGHTPMTDIYKLIPYDTETN